MWWSLLLILGLVIYLYCAGGTLTLWLQKYVYGREVYRGGSVSGDNWGIVFSFFLWPVVILWVGPCSIAKRIGIYVNE